jgi:hypothetical protein
MDRREFLKGAAAGVAGTAVAGSGCAAPSAHVRSRPRRSVEEMQAFLERFDRGLDAIGPEGSLRGLLRAGTRWDEAKFREVTPLFNRTLRTLYAAGAVGELEPEDQLHPGVQARMWRLAPEIDGVVREHERLLAGLGPADHARMQAHLRADPELPLRLAEALDDAADENGLGPSRRGRFRLAATEIGTRLRTQPPALLVGEYLDKARRIEERGDGVGALQRAIAGRAGEAAFWDAREWVDRETLAWRERLAAAGSGDGEGPDPAHRSAAGRMGLRALRTLGYGVVVGGVSAAIVSAGAPEGVLGVTAGVILVAIGLIELLLSGLMAIGEGIDAHQQRKAAERAMAAGGPADGTATDPAAPSPAAFEPPAPPPSPPGWPAEPPGPSPAASDPPASAPDPAVR